MRNVVGLYATILIYAVIRYVAFAPRNLEHLPAFIVNKGVSMAAALCFAAGFREHWRRNRGKPVGTDPAVWFRAGIVGAVVHVPLALAVLKPSYFKEFFGEGDQLSFHGEAVILFGGLTAGGVYLLARSNWTPRHRWWLSVATIATLFGHTLCMGLARGLNISKSHGYLPPMWLISLFGIGLGAWFLLRSRPMADPDAGPGR